MFKKKKNLEDQFYWEVERTEKNFWQNAKDFLVEIVKVGVISFAIIILVRYFLIKPFYVRGASMEPNFYDYEYLIVDEISYRFRAPERGEIVVFHYPKDPTQFFIKRIIGLPNETVEVINGQIIVYNNENPQGKILIEDQYLDLIDTKGNKKVKLGHDEYFVMGDNRDSSLDSRTFGPVADRYIIGRVMLRGWPLDRITIFDKPIYNF